MESKIIYLPLILSILGLVFMYIKANWVRNQDPGNEKMQEISSSIKQGALAFLNAEYRLLFVFVVIASAALFVISLMVESTSWMIVPAFIIGAVFSALAGNIGMRIATEANARTAEAAKTSLPKALQVSFGGGTVMGLGVAGLAVFGLTILFLFFVNQFVIGDDSFYYEMTVVLETLAGFSLGAESIALFARVGGGIYTKAADVGADLVGKVEAGIPEDDPRNPATIADNVGDNVGDVAGMGADLFGSYVATVLAAMVLGNYVIRDMSVESEFIDQFNNMGPILLPVLIAGVGILASIIGTFFVKINENSSKESKVQSALDLGNWISIFITLVASYFLIKWMLPKTMNMMFFGEGYREVSSFNVFGAACIGLSVGALISLVTAYYTSLGKKPVLEIVKNSSTGAATNIIAGLAVGMKSTFLSVILFAAAIFTSYALSGFYGVALAASAMMATTAMQLAIDAFGPIADNAGGVAEMSELPKEVRQRTDILDSVGNTTAAVGKGFAIASAALTALALFAAYMKTAGVLAIDVSQPKIMAGLLIGGMLPFVFSALSMNAVGRAAMAMIEEVRRQFRDIPALKAALEVMRKNNSDMSKATAKDRKIFDAADGVAEYDKCVAISTTASIKEMILPGVLAIVVPVGVGFFGGAEMLGGLLAGVTTCGVLMAIFQSNAGGAWDNAKKMIEEQGKKGTDAHKAAVVGDTVGDPFKDTSGPSLNILLKLMSVVALVIAPSIAIKNDSVTTYVNSNQNINNFEIVINTNQAKDETLHFNEFSKKKEKK